MIDNKISKDKSGSSWMNFKKLFKDYGCCGGDRDDLSESSSGSKKRKMLPKKKKIEAIYIEAMDQQKGAPNPEEDKSGASSTQWTDLEEIPNSTDPNVKLTQAYPHGVINNHSIEMEEYMTQEPIDFDSLKHLANSERNLNEEESNVSSLSKNTKKIRKDNDHSYLMNHNNLKSKIKRTPWQPYEDAQVIEYVEKYGARWAKIASMLPGRTGKQVRDRYTNKLKPNIKKDEWTKEEEELFNTLCLQMGHKWSKIASYLPGRTEGQVKNRYYAQFRKKPKDGQNDQNSMTHSDGDPKKEVKNTSGRDSSHNIEIEEPISYKNEVESELQKYIQVYLSEEKDRLKEEIESLPKSLMKRETLLSPSNINDPTNVISYGDNPSEGINFENSHFFNTNNHHQLSLSDSLLKINSGSLMLTTPRKNKERSLDDFNLLSIPKEKDLSREKLFGRQDSPISFSKERKDILKFNKCCVNSMEVLDKCENLSKRMNNIEFLLLNILKDMKEIKFQASHN